MARTVLMLLTNAYDPDPRVREEALALTRMGCRVRILAWDRDAKRPASEVMEGVEVDRVFVSSTHGRGATQVFFYAWVYLLLFVRAWRTRFDALHCHDLDTLPIGYVLGKIKRRPVVYDAHESFPDMLEGNIPRWLQRGLARLEDFLIRRVDLLITVGEKLRGHFAERGARRSVVVGNWKRTAQFSRSPQQNRDTRARLGIPDDALLVVCVTQLLKDRKIEELLAAVDMCSGVYVLIAGQGVLEEMVRRAAAANPRILYVGFASGPAIADYTCAADVVYYGFDPENPNARFSAPNKLYEALAAGRPLITGNFGEIADVVRNNRCGIVLSAYSAAAIAAALTVMADRRQWAEMAERSAELGRTLHNWEVGEAILYREYAALLPGLQEPESVSKLSLTQLSATGR